MNGGEAVRIERYVRTLPDHEEPTEEMINAGFKVLADSGITDDPGDVDRLLVEQIFAAILRARPGLSVRRVDDPT